MSTILGFLQTMGPFLFVLGVLIFVHELGHFLVARWYGVKVLAFSLGFGPKLFKVTRGDTEYCISVIPLGGYVKLAGETVEDKPSGDPTEFLSKSKWVRFQVYLAGPVMNIVLALLLTTVILATQGADVPLYWSAPPVIGAVASDGVAARAGLQVGDRVVRVNDSTVETWDQFEMAVLLRAKRETTMVVERAGTFVDISLTPDAEGPFDVGRIGVDPVLRPQVQIINPDSPGEKAGFALQDVVLAVNGERGLTRDGIVAQIQKHANVSMTFTVERAGAVQDIQVTPEVVGDIGMVGMQISDAEFRRVDPGLFEAAQMSVGQNWESSKLIGTTLAGLFTRETPVNQLMGPVAIAQISGETAQLGWVALFALMSMISLNLGVLNLMPIPVLDGGHITILAMEGLARRDFSVKVKERILLVGFAAILMLMVTVIFNDVARLMR
jgi:regulator of sigma E protease